MINGSFQSWLSGQSGTLLFKALCKIRRSRSSCILFPVPYLSKFCAFNLGRITAKNRGCRAEIAEKEVEEKGKRVDATGETADEIFYEAKPEAEALNVDDTGETAGETFYEAEPEAEALSVDDKDPETKEELYLKS